MLKPGQRLRFLLEAPEEFEARQAWPDDLQRNRAARMFLLGLIHRSHATFAEHPDDSIHTDTGWREGSAVDRATDFHAVNRGDPDDFAQDLRQLRTLSRLRQVRVGIAKQRLDFILECRVFGACGHQIRRAFTWLLFESGVVQGFNDCPSLGVHRIPPGSLHGPATPSPGSSPGSRSVARHQEPVRSPWM